MGELFIGGLVGAFFGYLFALGQQFWERRVRARAIRDAAILQLLTLPRRWPPSEDPFLYVPSVPAVTHLIEYLRDVHWGRAALQNYAINLQSSLDVFREVASLWNAAALTPAEQRPELMQLESRAQTEYKRVLFWADKVVGILLNSSDSLARKERGMEEELQHYDPFSKPDEHPYFSVRTDSA